MTDLAEFHSLLDMFEQVEREHNLTEGAILESLVDEYNARIAMEEQKAKEERPVYEH
jgi:hypothetical protein